MQEHPAALDHDCMVKTGRTLASYADEGEQGLIALSHLARYLGPESATWQATHDGDELPGWTTRPSTNAILADIYDAVAALNRNFASAHSRRKIPAPKPYPRPNATDRGERIGKGAIRIADFERWWNTAG